MVISLLLPLKFAIRTWSCNCPQYLCSFRIVVECSPSLRDPGKMLVLPNRLLYGVLSTSDQCFVSFQPIRCHPHTQIRRTLFHGVRISIPNGKPSLTRADEIYVPDFPETRSFSIATTEILDSNIFLQLSTIRINIPKSELFHNRLSEELSRIACPTIVLQKDDRTDFVQEERLDLPYWTMIWAIRVLVDVPKYLDILTWEFKIILEHLPFWPECKQILRLLLLLCIYDIHDLCCRHLWCWWSLHGKYSIRSWIIFHNIASQYDSTLYFWNRGSNSEFLRWPDPLTTQNARSCLFSLLRQLLPFCSWLLSAAMPVFSRVFPLLPSHLLFSLLET